MFRTAAETGAGIPSPWAATAASREGSMSFATDGKASGRARHFGPEAAANGSAPGDGIPAVDEKRVPARLACSAGGAGDARSEAGEQRSHARSGDVVQEQGCYFGRADGVAGQADQAHMQAPFAACWSCRTTSLSCWHSARREQLFSRPVDSWVFSERHSSRREREPGTKRLTRRAKPRSQPC